MKKAIVLFIVLLPAAAYNEENDFSISSDAEGKRIVAFITRDNANISCELDAKGVFTGMKAYAKDAFRDKDRISFMAYFSEGRVRSVYYNYYDGNEGHSAMFYKDSAEGKRLIAVFEQSAQKLEKKYNLAKLARKEAKAKQAEYKKFLEEEERREAEKAKRLPKPGDALKKFFGLL